MAVLHSALTDHERLVAWARRFPSGRARIVLGNPLGVCSPRLPELGLIVVRRGSTTRHSSNTKGGFPLFSPRDLAVMRGPGNAAVAGGCSGLGHAGAGDPGTTSAAGARYARLRFAATRAGESQPPAGSRWLDLRNQRHARRA